MTTTEFKHIPSQSCQQCLARGNFNFLQDEVADLYLASEELMEF